jgi:hypothetical protein
MQGETACAVLSAAAATLGYSSWPFVLKHLATPLCIAWVSTGGTILDFASSSHLLDLPTCAPPVDTQGVPALAQTGLPDATVAMHVPEPPPHNASEGLLSDRVLFWSCSGLPDPQNSARGLLSSAHAGLQLPVATESLSALEPAVLHEVQRSKAVSSSLLVLQRAFTFSSFWRPLQFTLACWSHTRSCLLCCILLRKKKRIGSPVLLDSRLREQKKRVASHAGQEPIQKVVWAMMCANPNPFHSLTSYRHVY